VIYADAAVPVCNAVTVEAEKLAVQVSVLVEKDPAVTSGVLNAVALNVKSARTAAPDGIVPSGSADPAAVVVIRRWPLLGSALIASSAARTELLAPVPKNAVIDYSLSGFAVIDGRVMLP
jgi:hypothetical protein